MKTTIKYLILTILLFQGRLFSQSTGEIKGIVIDKETGKTAIGANVSVQYAGNLIGEASDLDGKYTIKPLIPGTYALTVSFSGKGTKTFTNIIVNPNKITFMDTIFLQDSSVMIGDFTVVANKIIDPEGPSMFTLTSNEIVKMAGARSGNSLMAIASDGAMKTSADGQEVYFRGSRNSTFITFFDGIKISGGAPAVPIAAIKSYSVYTGGLPAKYGDTSGGVVVIETKSYFDLYNQWVAKNGTTYTN